MAMSRSFGWTLFTTRLPIDMVPDVMFSSPASMRSSVDLPQPDGPTRTTKAPSSIGTVTPCRTSNPPNDFRTSLICTDAIELPSLYFRISGVVRRSPSLLCFSTWMRKLNPKGIVRNSNSSSNPLVALSIFV